MILRKIIPSFFFVIVISFFVLGNTQVFACLQEGMSAVSEETPWQGNEIVVTNFDIDQYHPEAAYNSIHDEYLVVYQNTHSDGSRDIYATRLNGKGEFISWFSIRNGSDQMPVADKLEPSVAYDPVYDRYLVVFSYDFNNANNDWDIHGQMIPWDGPDSNFNEFYINADSGNQTSPKVVYSTVMEEFLVTWEDDGSGASLPPCISWQRVAASDQSLVGSSTTIYNFGYYWINPDVAYNTGSNEYLLVFEDNGGDIWGTRIDATGDPITPTLATAPEFYIANWGERETKPAVASCGDQDQYLVSWQSNQTRTGDDIYARFVSGNGTPGNVYELFAGQGDDQESDVTCRRAGNEYFVSWQAEYSDVHQTAIWGRLVQTDESIGETFEVVPPTITNSRTLSAAVASPYNYLVVWEHDRDNLPSYQDVHGKLLSPNKIFLPAVFNHP